MQDPLAAVARALATALLAAAVAGCGGGGNDAGPGTATTGVTDTTPRVVISPRDRPACALLFARLQRVTVALQTSSELIAHSLNKRQLSRRIHTEEVQLRRSARLMTGGPTPAPLGAANRQLVSALLAFSRDFARAQAPAARGDLEGAARAMSDPPVVQKIVRASRTIENACG